MAKKSLTGFDANGQRVQNIGAATQPTDAVNLNQMQAAIAGLSWHGTVRVASTGNINLAAPSAAIDGVNLAVGDRVLLKNQTTASQNGVYVFEGAAAALVLAADGQQGELAAGAAFYANEGTANGDTAWTLTTNNPVTVGTTALTFAQFGAGMAYTAGPGIVQSGNQFALDTTVASRKVAATVGDGSSTSIAVTHNLGTLDVQVQLYEVATGITDECDVTRTSLNAVTLGFGTAPTAGQYRALIQG